MPYKDVVRAGTKRRRYSNWDRVRSAVATIGPGLRYARKAAGWHERNMWGAVKQSMLRRKPKAVPAKFITKGSLAPKFRAKKRVNYNGTAYSKQGVIGKYEIRGVTTDPDAIYVGHCTMPEEHTLDLAIAALLRKQFRMSGIEVEQWDSNLGHENSFTVGEFHYNWRPSSTGGVSSNSVTMVAATTLRNVVGAIRADWRTQFAAHDDAQLDSVWLVLRQDTVANAPNNVSGYLNVNRLTLHYRNTSNMVVQNRTLATTATGDESNRNDIANNPLTGKLYQGSGNGLKLPIKDDLQPQDTLIANATEGLISAVPATMSNAQFRAFRRPPLGRVLQGCKSWGGIFLNPGNIRTSKLYTTKVVKFNTLIAALSDRFSVNFNGPPKKWWFGKCAIVGLQKRCDTGTEEPSISVGYEIEQRFECYLSNERADFISGLV